MLSQFNQNYGMQHWKAAKRVLRHLNRRTPYRKADADWGSCIHDRHSGTGYIFKLAGGAVSCISNMEAEYMALTEAVKETIYLKSFLQELDIYEEKNNYLQ